MAWKVKKGNKTVWYENTVLRVNGVTVETLTPWEAAVEKSRLMAIHGYKEIPVGYVCQLLTHSDTPEWRTISRADNANSLRPLLKSTLKAGFEARVRRIE